MNTLFFDKNVVHFGETHNMDKGNYTIVIEPHDITIDDIEPFGETERKKGFCGVFDGTVCPEATGASIGTLLPEIGEIHREETVCYDGTMQRSYNYVLNTK